MKKIVLLGIIILLLGCIQSKTGNGNNSSNATIDDLIDKTWYSVEPIQCGMNPWEKVEEGKEGYQGTVENWLKKEYGVEVYKVESKLIYSVVCEACDCPRGDLLKVLVDSRHEEKMLELGFKKG